MTSAWPSVPLGEVLTQSVESVEILPDQTYREVTVRLWGRGVVLRRKVEGSGIASARRNVVRSGQLLLSRIDARNGAIGVVPEELDGAVVSNDFPSFDLSRARVIPGHASWLCRTHDFVDKCKTASEGTTNRVRLDVGRFLRLPIPLPPLAEQRRIVARIEELAGKAAEARSLSQHAILDADALSMAGGDALFEDAARRFGQTKLETVTSRITKGESPEWQGFSYQDTGPLFIRSENVLWGALDPTNAVRISEEFHQKLARSQLRTGDVLINLVGASIGRACAVPPMLGEANVNQAVAVITPNSESVVPEFLVRFLLSPSAQDIIHGGKVETARPNISLGDLREIELPPAPLPEQRRIVDYLNGLQAKVDELKRLQAETQAELDALLPSILDRAFKGEL